MNTIPTAKEFWDSKCKTDELKSPGDIMIEFAKMHVEVALKEAIKVEVWEQRSYRGLSELEKDSILNAYPLENIK